MTSPSSSRIAVIATLVLALIGVPTAADCQKPCPATPLSKKEAVDLLRFIPAAQAAQQIGGSISAVDWSPGYTFRDDVYYFFMLLSTKSPPGSPLDNGMLGYFGVNKMTGQVVELNS